MKVVIITERNGIIQSCVSIIQIGDGELEELNKVLAPLLLFAGLVDVPDEPVANLRKAVKVFAKDLAPTITSKGIREMKERAKNAFAKEAPPSRREAKLSVSTYLNDETKDLSKTVRKSLNVLIEEARKRAGVSDDPTKPVDNFFGDWDTNLHGLIEMTGMALDKLRGESYKKNNLVKKLRKALGYTYP